MYTEYVDKLLFSLAMIFSVLSGKIADTEMAFLYGKLEEQLYMEYPPGITGVTQDHMLALMMCTYGLVQAVR